MIYIANWFSYKFQAIYTNGQGAVPSSCWLECMHTYDMLLLS